jgi:hypothetical protein
MGGQNLLAGELESDRFGVGFAFNGVLYSIHTVVTTKPVRDQSCCSTIKISYEVPKCAMDSLLEMWFHVAS